MMLLQPRTSPLLTGGDPAPGDGEYIADTVRRLRGIADTAGDASSRIGRVGSDATLWTGPAATAFAEHRVELVQHLQATQRAYEHAAEAVDSWLPLLQALQAEAAQIVTQAEQARGSAEANDAMIVFAPAAEMAIPGLAALQKRYHDVARRAGVADRRCSHALDEATRLMPKPPHRGPWKTVTSELLSASHFLHDVDKWLSTVALLTTFIPVVGEVVDTVTIAAVGVTLAIDVTLAGSGEAGWGEVGEDLTSFVPVAVGAPFKAAARSARASAQLGKGAAGAEQAARHVVAKGYLWSFIGQEEKAGAAGTAAQTLRANASRFAERADHAASTSAFSDAAVAAGKEFRHPIKAGIENYKLSKVVKESSAYGQIPKLENWLPTGHRFDAVGDLTARGTEKLESISHVVESLPEDQEHKP